MRALLPTFLTVLKFAIISHNKHKDEARKC